jgi:1,2-phenylacetyl-CoA epoxidase catalytic subunit
MADVVITKYINVTNVNQLSNAHINKLITIIESMLVHHPFEVITVHDEFKCHANNMNHLRQHYINVFAELAESNVLSDILSQIHGVPGNFPKLSQDLGAKIRGSNYALS